VRQRIESRWGRKFPHPSKPVPRAHQASYTLAIGYFPRVKRPGCGVDHPPPSNAKVKERGEVHIYSPSGPLWPVLGRTLPLLLPKMFWCPQSAITVLLLLLLLLFVFTHCFHGTQRIFHSMSSSSWLKRWLLHCLLLLYCAATEYSPEQDLLLLCCTATEQEQGPVQGPSDTTVLCQRTRPSKGVGLGPNTEDFSYCSVATEKKPSTVTFRYCSVLPQSRVQYRGLLLLYCVAKEEHGPAWESDYGVLWRTSLTVQCCHGEEPSTEGL
jgi:hypothetical protein